MNNICYLCGYPLSDNPSLNEVLPHSEHIIHNGIGGKLRTKKILCQKCGGSFSTEDSNFVALFSGFYDLMYPYLFRKDHGSKERKKLYGFLYNNGLDNIPQEVYAKNGQVYPRNPYYVIDEEKENIQIYAAPSRLKDFEKQIRNKCPKYSNYRSVYISDISGLGELALFFSEGNNSFNEDFKNGIVKIAIEFALYNNIDRQDMPLALKFYENGSSKIDCYNTPVIPFCPQSSSSLYVEMVEDVVDDNYPSHIIRLFSQKYDNRNALICYVCLFSTFKYYVILNNNYERKEIDEIYAQRILKIRNGIKYSVSQYKLDTSLENIMKQALFRLSDFINQRIVPDCICRNKVKSLLDNAISDEGINSLIQELIENHKIDNYIKNTIICHNDATKSVINNAESCTKQVEKSGTEELKFYTNFKFEQLNRFCWNIARGTSYPNL